MQSWVPGQAPLRRSCCRAGELPLGQEHEAEDRGEQDGSARPGPAERVVERVVCPRVVHVQEDVDHRAEGHGAELQGQHRRDEAARGRADVVEAHRVGRGRGHDELDPEPVAVEAVAPGEGDQHRLEHGVDQPSDEQGASPVRQVPPARDDSGSHQQHDRRPDEDAPVEGDPHAELVGEPLEALGRDVEDVVVVGAGRTPRAVHPLRPEAQQSEEGCADRSDDQRDRQVLPSPAQDGAHQGNDHRGVQPAPERDAAEQADGPPASGRTPPSHARDAQQRDRVRPHGVCRDRPHRRREAQDGHCRGSTPLRELRSQGEEHEQQRQGGSGGSGEPARDDAHRVGLTECVGDPVRRQADGDHPRETRDDVAVVGLHDPDPGLGVVDEPGDRVRAEDRRAGVHQVPGRVVRGVVVPAAFGFEARGQREQPQRDEEQRQGCPPPTASPARGRLRGLGGGSQHGRILVHGVRLRPRIVKMAGSAGPPVSHRLLVSLG